MSKNYPHIFITLVLVGFFAVSCARQPEPEQPAAPLGQAQINETLARADALFKQRGDLEKLRQAVKIVAGLRRADQRVFEVESKFAEYNYFLGKQISDDKESDKVFEDGKQAAQIVERIAPDKADGYFWYAANLGEQARKSPLTVGITSTDEIKTRMNKVIEIQPDFQGASAYDALGLLELETGLIGGSAQKAVEYLEKGISVDPNNTYLHLHLARAYLKTNRPAEAKKQLEIILKTKPDPDYAAEYQETADEAKKLLATKF